MPKYLHFFSFTPVNKPILYFNTLDLPPYLIFKSKFSVNQNFDVTKLRSLLLLD